MITLLVFSLMPDKISINDKETQDWLEMEMIGNGYVN